MKTVKFESIEEEVISSFKRKSLIPFIGAGFTKHCISHSGCVPSGKEYKALMIDSILEVDGMGTQEEAKLQSKSFSDVSSVYYKLIPSEKRRRILKERFTHVICDEDKNKFLNIDWPYIYTLNIDDAIERNSQYNHVITSNRSIYKDIYNENKCVIKLHGDVNDIISYTDSDCEIFTKEQYLASINKNECLLQKLKNDYIYNNIIYIGCSLTDEIDLLSCSLSTQDKITSVSKYYFCTKEPDYFDKIKLEEFGISDIVIFDQYNDIYTSIYNAWIESNKISNKTIENFTVSNINEISYEFDKNAPYLFFGKSLIDSERKINKPYFFIERDIMEKLVGNINKIPIQILFGSGCSGRTYALIDLAMRVKNKEIYFFQSKDKIRDDALNDLLTKNNVLVIFDDFSLSQKQIENIIKMGEFIKSKRSSIIICGNKNNRDLIGILKFMKMNSYIREDLICEYQIRNVFNENELLDINSKLSYIEAGIFKLDNSTIIDNIIDMSDHLALKNKYSNISPYMNNYKMLASLISLLIERKIYSDRAVNLDLTKELEMQIKRTYPLIDREETYFFEKDASNNAPVKYVLNAEYWLNNQFVKHSVTGNKKLIIDAYCYLVKKIISFEGAPDILNFKNSSYKQYILFDNINRIFYSKRNGSKNGIELIKCIYDALSEFLSNDPNFMHQRAKCYTRLALFKSNSQEKLKFLDDAFRIANVAEQIFNQRYNISENIKTKISSDHICYTKAVILCHKCKIHDYTDFNENSRTIEILYNALKSDYNTYDYAKADSMVNYRNVVKEVITYFVINNQNFNELEKYQLQELLNIIRK